MEKTKKKSGTVTVTRAEKKDRTKNLIRETLERGEYKHNDLIDETAKMYAQRFEGEETDNINDVRGRIGSVLDIMKKEGEVTYEGGMYALKKETVPEKVKKTAQKTAKKATKKADKAEEAEKAEKTEKEVKKEAPKKRATKKKTEKKEEVELPVQPIEPVPAPIVIPEPEQEKTEEAPKEITAKKRGRSKKTEEKKQEVKTEEKATEEKKEEPKTAPAPVEINTAAEKSVMDMSFLFKAPKAVAVKQEIQEKAGKAAEPILEKKEDKRTAERKTPVKAVKSPQRENKMPARSLTADEKLKEAYLKRLHKLGGDYFEYYSVYLLERYCRLNGRRLESMKITAGDRDGGIDGEIELTDKFGFRETIYIQAKNWDPEKGDEKLWVVGETLLQQFIGACVCRQAKDGKQHCRGIFITTSRFTPEAKSILDSMSEKIIGYDGTDLYEAAKECAFGLVKKNGEWALDENLLSGGKAFFNLF